MGGAGVDRLVRTQVFWRGDIASVLRALALAGRSSGVAGDEAFRAGFLAALVAVGAAFDAQVDDRAGGVCVSVVPVVVGEYAGSSGGR